MTCSSEFDARDAGEKARKRKRMMSACESR